MGKERHLRHLSESKNILTYTLFSNLYFIGNSAVPTGEGKLLALSAVVVPWEHGLTVK